MIPDIPPGRRERSLNDGIQKYESRTAGSRIRCCIEKVCQPEGEKFKAGYVQRQARQGAAGSGQRYADRAVQAGGLRGRRPGRAQLR